MEGAPVKYLCIPPTVKHLQIHLIFNLFIFYINDMIIQLFSKKVVKRIIFLFGQCLNQLRYFETKDMYHFLHFVVPVFKSQELGVYEVQFFVLIPNLASDFGYVA